MKKLLTGMSRAIDRLLGASTPPAASAPRATAAGRSKLHLRALEPRVLLDAAAAATMAETMEQADRQQRHDQPAHDAAQDQHDALLQALATGETSPQPQLNIVFIDSSVEDAQQLIAAIGNTAEVHLIAAGEDGVQAIAQALAGRSGVDSIHIISHGHEGVLELGSAVLDAETMKGMYADMLQGLRSSLAPDADILVYGCDFGGGTAGEEAALLLSSLTGADVAASIDATGAASLGGDWDLELHDGSIEAKSIDVPDWDHLLAPGLTDTALTMTVNEDPGAPSGAVGQLVGAYDGGVTGATNKGIAVTGVTNGTLWYSTDNGAHWTQAATPTAAASLLLADDGQTRLYYQPNANYNGAATVTLRAWDRTTGTNGGTFNTASGGGTTGTSTQTDTIDVTVNSVNDAPSGADKTITVNEDNVYNFTAADFGFTDTSDTPANALKSVLITTIPTGGHGLLSYVNASGQRVFIANNNTTITAAQAAILDINEGLDHNAIGPELLTNPDFASLTGWTSNSSAALMTTPATNPGVELEGNPLSPTSTQSTLSQTIPTVPGAAYQVTVSMYAEEGTESVGMRARSCCTSVRSRRAALRSRRPRISARRTSPPSWPVRAARRSIAA